MKTSGILAGVSEPAAASSPPPEERLRLTDGVRHLIRQVATAVYVYVLFALLARWLVHSVAAVFAVELALTFAAGVILALVVEGPLWATGLVGVFVATFDVALSIVAGEWRGRVLEFALAQVGPALAVVAAGLAGALVARRVHRRKQAA